ncbi:MAG: tyrosine-type recombinase/integrase [Candidatus Diapherotrites archaeon]|nr:tyrosine-type recombinase/integrase [Candidatus Diapherotrites archaeon]
MDLPEENKAAIEAFNSEYIGRGVTAGARIHYLRFLEVFCSFCKKQFSQVTKQDIVDFMRFVQEYQSKIYGRKLSKSTIGHYKTALKYFFVKLYEGKSVERNSRGIPMPVAWITSDKNDRVLKRPEDMLSQAQVKTLIEAADNPRDKAMISVLYEGALRASELLDMTSDSVKLDKYGAIISVRGKTGQRTIRLINSVPDLTVWLNCHPLKSKENFYLWTAIRKRVPRSFESTTKTHFHYYGERLRIKGLQGLMWKLKDRAGIQKRVHPHLLRHTRLTELAKKLTEQELKMYAGWSPESRMASQYVHLSGRDIDNSILRINGIIPDQVQEEQQELKPHVCARCQQKNPATARFCYKCSAVLDIKTALELHDTQEKDAEALMVYLQQTQEQFNEALNRLQKLKNEGKNPSEPIKTR